MQSSKSQYQYPKVDFEIDGESCSWICNGVTCEYSQQEYEQPADIRFCLEDWTKSYNNPDVME